MPAPSPSQRVEALQQELARLSATVGRGDGVNAVEHARLRERLTGVATELAGLRDRLKAEEEKVVALERRCAALEQWPDRVWQFAPMVISVLAALLSVVVAFVRR